jgi:hypothetical protein
MGKIISQRISTKWNKPGKNSPDILNKSHGLHSQDSSAKIRVYKRKTKGV